MAEVQIESSALAQSSYLGLFSWGLTTPEHRRSITVARQAMLDDALTHLRRSLQRKLKQHLLYIGPRGSGKTHFLSLIEDEIQRNHELNVHFIVVRFPEETGRILSFADFLLRVCEELTTQLPQEKVWQTLYRRLETEADDADIIDTLVPAIRSATEDMHRTVLIMLENVHDVFERQMKERIDVGALRKFLMGDNGCQLIATAPIYFEGITSVDEPFFDFFDVQVIDLLTKDQAIELVRRNLEWEQRSSLLRDFESLRPKLAALYDMTAGNPRLTHMLYELIVHDSIAEVSEQFRRLLDRVTPFYQDRLKELAPRERALLETLALMRDDSEPKTPRRLAEKLRISEQQTSSLLKRLTISGYIRSSASTKDKRSRLYVISEGFFDLWLAMQLSRRHRRRLPILVECLAKFYPRREDREAKRREYRQHFAASCDAQAALGLLSDIGTTPEQTLAKLDLVSRHAVSGNLAEKAEVDAEIQSLPLDSIGTWIVEWVSCQEPRLNYLDEIEQLIELWSLHRSGDLEAFMERFTAMGSELNYRTYSAAKLAFLRDHLSLLTDSRQRVELQLRLGALLREQAAWNDAETMFREALRGAESLQRQDLTAAAIYEMSLLLRETNRLTEAEPLSRRALQMHERSRGPDHASVASCLNNLAELLRSTNRLSEAEPLYRRALAIQERSYGPDHPTVATSLNNLASLLETIDEVAAAEPLCRRALLISERSYGPDHPTVASCLNNLANLLSSTDRLPEAEPLYRRALQIHERSYGADHPEVATALNNLAGLLYSTNRPGEAETLSRRALTILTRFRIQTGHSHRCFAVFKGNYQRILESLDIDAAARKLRLREVEDSTGRESSAQPDNG
jgi:tetratricopeptide (TPR) repeat protein